MRLGTQDIALVRFTVPGRPYPRDSRSDDLWFQHLAIVVDDLEQSACFYEKIFEMTRAYEAKGRAIYLTDGLVNLALLSSANKPSAGATEANAHGISHFGFRVPDFASIEAALTEAGATYAYDLGDPKVRGNM